MRTFSVGSRLYSTRNLSHWQARLLAAGFLLLLTLLYFHRQLIDGQVLYWGDIGLYFTPMEVFLKQNLDAGRLPLWNPLILCGTPYVGNPQTWPLYPVTALLPFVSAPQFFNLTIALHVWLAGLGTYAFARRALGVGRGPALLAAVTFMFGGQLVSKEQFPNMVQAAAWLPWVLFCLHSLLRRKRLRDVLALGLVLGLQLLAAHVQMTLLTLYLALAYGIFVSSSRSRKGKEAGPPAPNNGGVGLEEGAANKEGAASSAPAGFRLTPPELGAGGRVPAFLVLSGMIASGLAMGQVLPTLALFRDAARHKLSFAVVDRFYLPLNQLGNFVFPNLHGSPYYGNWTARGNAWETCCYVGVISFGLALWGGWTATRRPAFRAIQFWAGVFLFGLWMAFGGHGGLYHLAYFVLPGFRSFHDPARCLLWSCFALSLLSAFGLERLPRLNSRKALIFGVLLLAFADLAHFGQTLYPLAQPAALFQMAPNISIVQADPDIKTHQARILAPTGGVWLRFTSYKDYRQSTANYQALWADTLTSNLMMPYGLSDAFGYEPVALKNTETVAAEASRDFDAKATAPERAEAAELSGTLGVKYVSVCRVAPPEKTLPGLIAVRAAPTLALPGHKHKPQASVYLSRNLGWQPRAHLENSAAPVKLTDNSPDRVTLTFRNSAPTRLILEDTQAAGWQASLDGEPAPIAAYHGCLRTVTVIQPGVHSLVFSYAPTPFRLGLYVSLLTLACLFGAAGFGVTRNYWPGEGLRRPPVE